jgi:NAD kinase
LLPVRVTVEVVLLPGFTGEGVVVVTETGSTVTAVVELATA